MPPETRWDQSGVQQRIETHGEPWVRGDLADGEQGTITVGQGAKTLLKKGSTPTMRRGAFQTTLTATFTQNCPLGDHQSA